MHKLTSRKFWLAVAGSASGIATIVGGIASTSETHTLILSIVGTVMLCLSVVGYNFAEAYVDGKSAMSDTSNIYIAADTPKSVETLINSGAVEIEKIGGTD